MDRTTMPESTILSGEKGRLMMAEISVNVCMDEDLLRQFEGFCDEIDVSVNMAFCIFAKTVVREWKFPFELPQEDDAQKMY